MTPERRYVLEVDRLLKVVLFALFVGVLAACLAGPGTPNAPVLHDRLGDGTAVGPGFAPMQRGSVGAVTPPAPAIPFTVDLFLDWQDYNYNSGGVATWTNSAGTGVASFGIYQSSEATKPTEEADAVRSTGVQGLVFTYNATPMSGATTSATLWFRMKRSNTDPLKYFLMHTAGGYGKSVSAATSGDGSVARIMGQAGVATALTDAGFFDTNWHVYAFQWDYAAQKVRAYKDGTQFGSDLGFTTWQDSALPLSLFCSFPYGSDSDYKYIVGVASAVPPAYVASMSTYLGGLP